MRCNICSITCSIKEPKSIISSYADAPLVFLSPDDRKLNAPAAAGVPVPVEADLKPPNPAKTLGPLLSYKVKLCLNLLN